MWGDGLFIWSSVLLLRGEFRLGGNVQEETFLQMLRTFHNYLLWHATVTHEKNSIQQCGVSPHFINIVHDFLNVTLWFAMGCKLYTVLLIKMGKFQRHHGCGNDKITHASCQQMNVSAATWHHKQSQMLHKNWPPNEVHNCWY